VNEVTIYTDGACSYNPGPGGWAAVLLTNSKCKEIFGGEKHTTNNRMELTAVIKALQALKVPCKVNIYSDSAYIVNCFQQKWYIKWQKNGWCNSTNQQVENQDLWKELLNLTKIHQVEFIKVKGHSNIDLNNRCDKLARASIPK
jgi:ribonuclease HI